MSATKNRRRTQRQSSSKRALVLDPVKELPPDLSVGDDWSTFSTRATVYGISREFSSGLTGQLEVANASPEHAFVEFEWSHHYTNRAAWDRRFYISEFPLELLEPLALLLQTLVANAKRDGVLTPPVHPTTSQAER